MKTVIFKLSFVIVSLFTFCCSFLIISFADNSDKIIGYKMDSNRNIENVYYSDTLGNNITETSGFINDDSKIEQSICNRIIIGDDDRVVVPNSSMTSYPYRMVCRIEVQYNETPGTVYLGTGFLVAPNTIMTACHAIYHENYGFFDSINFGFGAYKDDVTGQITYPYGTYNLWTAATVGSYYDTFSENDDWAIIDVSTNIGNDLGYFGLTANLSTSDNLRLYGYYGDFYGNQGYCDGNATYIETYRFFHTCDSYGGVSGGPICENNVIVAGIQHGWLGTINTACKISTYIVGWINDRINGN